MKMHVVLFSRLGRRLTLFFNICIFKEMASQEHDSGIMQWARNLLDGDPVYNSVHYGDMIQHDANDIYRGQYARGQYDTESNHVENDEVIAYTLQEEYSRLSVAEDTGYSHAEEEHSQASTHADDWDGLSRRGYCLGIPKTVACTTFLLCGNLYHLVVLLEILSF